MSKQVKLTRRRVLGILITIGLAGAAMGVGTYALFSDEETSSNNEISAGTLSLEGAADENLTANDLVPGTDIPENGGSAWINTTYVGDVNQVNVTFSSSLSQNDSANDPFDENMTATEFGSQVDVETAILYRNGDNTVDLTTDLDGGENVSTLADFDNLTVDDVYTGVTPDDRISLELQLRFVEGAGNDYQADGVDLAASFNATQQTP